jgi:WhiB family redox-sensing transcriptional regulator
MPLGRCNKVPTAVFFPGEGGGIGAARAICQHCEVRGSCLEYALVNRIPHGVWGGTSERERRRILRERWARERERQRSATATERAAPGRCG